MMELSSTVNIKYSETSANSPDDMLISGQGENKSVKPKYKNLLGYR